jgi:hypothetical protein
MLISLSRPSPNARILKGAGTAVHFLGAIQFNAGVAAVTISARLRL